VTPPPSDGQPAAPVRRGPSGASRSPAGGASTGPTRARGAGVPDRSGGTLPRTGDDLARTFGIGSLLAAAGGGLLAIRNRDPEAVRGTAAEDDDRA
jgi:LPXTG-motif cell wall-anchored protein